MQAQGWDGAGPAPAGPVGLERLHMLSAGRAQFALSPSTLHCSRGLRSLNSPASFSRSLPFTGPAAGRPPQVEGQEAPSRGGLPEAQTGSPGPGSSRSIRPSRLGTAGPTPGPGTRALTPDSRMATRWLSAGQVQMALHRLCTPHGPGNQGPWEPACGLNTAGQLHPHRIPARPRVPAHHMQNARDMHHNHAAHAEPGGPPVW